MGVVVLSVWDRVINVWGGRVLSVWGDRVLSVQGW